MSKKAVIFDMDGVLIDSEPVYLNTFRDFIVKNGGTVDEAVLKAIAGASTDQTWVYITQMWRETIDPEADSRELRQEFHRQYPEFRIPYGEVVYPGIEKLLSWLKEKGIRLALASSSAETNIRRMLEETGFAPYFDCIVSGHMFRESKPNPEIYLYTLSQLGLEAKECVVIEDSTYGIQAAKAAGLPVVAVKDYRFSYDQSGADWFVDQTADLRDIFETISDRDLEWK